MHGDSTGKQRQQTSNALIFALHLFAVFLKFFMLTPTRRYPNTPINKKAFFLTAWLRQDSVRVLALRSDICCCILLLYAARARSLGVSFAIEADYCGVCCCGYFSRFLGNLVVACEGQTHRVMVVSVCVRRNSDMGARDNFLHPTSARKLLQTRQPYIRGWNFNQREI